MQCLLILLTLLVLSSTLTEGFFLLKEKIKQRLFCKFCPLYCSPRKIDFDIDGLTSMIAEDRYDAGSDHIPYFKYLDYDPWSVPKPTTKNPTTKKQKEPCDEEYPRVHFKPYWEHTTNKPEPTSTKKLLWDEVPRAYDQYSLPWLVTTEKPKVTFTTNLFTLWHDEMHKDNYHFGMPWEYTTENPKPVPTKKYRELEWSEDPYFYDPRGPFWKYNKENSKTTTEAPDEAESHTFDYNYEDFHDYFKHSQMVTTEKPKPTEDFKPEYFDPMYHYWKPKPTPTTTTTTTTAKPTTTTSSPSGICMFCEKHCNFPPKEFW